MWDRLLSFFFLILPKSLKFTSSHRRRKLRSFRERRIWSANRNRTRKYSHFNRLRDSGYKSVPKMILILDGVVKTEERIIIWFFFLIPQKKKEGERHSFILFWYLFFFLFFAVLRWGWNINGILTLVVFEEEFFLIQKIFFFFFPARKNIMM